MQSSRPIRWYSSLRFQSVLVFGSIVGWLVLAIALAMNTFGRQVVSDQTEASVEQLGNNTVVGLTARLQEIAALTRTLAATARELPADERLYRQTLPGLLDFDGDLSVAGGGIWPEPFQFDDRRERASFFWGRDEQGRFEFYDDYNQPGTGYHQEAWYVVAQQLQPGTCAWSESYIDPYSQEPMVTCTVGIFEGGAWHGAATVDLNLGGLKGWALDSKIQSQGYLFLVDRHNRFITLPAQSRVSFPAEAGQEAESAYPLVAEFAAQNPEFEPIHQALTDVNEWILARAASLPEYDPAIALQLDRNSYQINAEEAELIAATLLDPFERNLNQNHLLTTVDVPEDLVLGQSAQAYIFHVPEAYWKIVMVMPDAAIAAPANQVMEWLLLCVLGATLIAAPIGYWGLKRWLLDPVADTTDEVSTMAAAIAEQKWDVIPHRAAVRTQANEIGLLRRVFYTLARTTADQSQELQATNRELRQSFEQLQTTQSQLVQAEKMSSLGQLVAGVAHEINNPVNFIHGNLIHAQTYTEDLLALAEAIDSGASPTEIETLIDEMDLDFLKEDLPKLLQSMQTGTHRIREIVLSLRNFSRLDEAERKAVDIHEGIDSTLTILKHRLKAHPDRPAIEIVKHYADLPLVECYPGPLNQVYMNLLGNALDALEDRDRHRDPAAIAARPSRIDITTEIDADNTLHIHISDNGPGMSPAVRDKIFEYLYTTKNAGQGTGLGLTISRDIVEGKHGGRLTVASTLGQGSTFTISLPLHPVSTERDSTGGAPAAVAVATT